MMAILPRFISDEAGLYLGDANSNTWVSMFKAGAYTLPLVGGFLADQYFGKYRLIVLFSIPYILGHFLMSYETVMWTMVALSLLAMGSGIIKPNISTLMGMTYDQKRPGDDALRSMAFGMFYMAINVGAFFSYLFLPVIRDDYGYSIAFMCPAVLMAVSFLIFAAGKPFYAVEKIVRTKATPEEWTLKLLTIRRVAGIFLVITFFWAIFDQSHTVWIYFARDFTDLKIFGFDISVEQIGTLNPLLIVVFIPLLPILWNFVEKQGYKVRPTDKIMIGFVLTCMTMGIMALAGYMCTEYDEKMVKKTEKAITKVEVDAPSKVSIDVVTGKHDLKKEKEVDAKDRSQLNVARSERVTITIVAETEKEQLRRFVTPENKVTLWWEVAAFVLLTLAEVLISVTGLELAFVVAPASMKSFVTALWLMTVAVANFFINAPVGRLYNTMSPGNYHLMLTGMMVVVIVVFYFVSQRFNQMAEEQQKAQEAAGLPPDEQPWLPKSVEPGGPEAGGIQDKSLREGIMDPDKKDDRPSS
jgi:dipeptide/tripeptide permease